MSVLTKAAHAVRDHAVSFGVGAVPAFLGTSLLAAGFVLFKGLGVAIGLPSAAATIGGVIGTLAVGSVTVGGGFLLGLAGLAGVAAVAGNAQMKTGTALIGAAAGLAASVAMAFNLSASDVQQQGSLPQPEPAVASLSVAKDVPDLMQASFIKAGNGTMAYLPPAASAPPSSPTLAI